MKQCRTVVGMDARQVHIESATLIQQIHELKNLNFIQGDVQQMQTAQLGIFDVVLAFGILYHVHDLVGALRNARALTGGVCLIETQVAPEMNGVVEWGSREWTREIRGCLALIDESPDLAAGTMESGMNSVSLVPSLNGLLFLLERAGFDRIEVLPPLPGTHEQHLRGERVMIAAYPAPSALRF
jgi:ubiquinone/menaquinone biosynthesis C-methylase UbiE